MKKIIVLGFSILYISLMSLSQNSYQIDTSSKWIQLESWGESSSWKQWNYSLSFQGDTIINDTVFLSMFLNGQHTYSAHGVDTAYSIFNSYFGAVKVDSGKVFFIPYDSITSITLYNFNYSINDTIKTIMGNGLQIIDIDTLIDGRKKFITNSSNQFNILEGIGSNHGFYYKYREDSYWYLVDTILGCYYQDDSLVFLNDYSVCYFPLPVDIYENSTVKKPKLYPNPAKNIIRIELNEPVENIEIYDIYGIKYHMETTPLNEIDITELSSGCYIMNINNRHIMKFIKK